MTDKPSDEIDWIGADLEVVRHVYSQGETYLKAQHQGAIAADQRATTMASILAAVSAALVAAAVNYAAKDGDALVVKALLASACALLLGAMAAFWAARPVPFNFSGNDPKNYYGSLGSDLATVLGGEAENYSVHIATNDELMGRNQLWVRAAMALAIAAPIAGAAVYWCCR